MNFKNPAPIRLFTTLCLVLPYIVRAVNPIQEQPTDRLTFAENKHQWPEAVLYKADLVDGAVYLEKNQFTYNFISRKDVQSAFHQLESGKGTGYPIQGHAVSMTLLNASTDVHISAAEKASSYRNYYSGSDPKHWASNVGLFSRVNYGDLYPHIDMTVYTHENSLEYDFILAPGADPQLIQMDFSGAEQISVRKGQIQIRTCLNSFVQDAPYAWQVIKGHKTAVACRYVLKDHVIGFQFPEGYDQSLPLTIDPTLIFSTYTGSTALISGDATAYDLQGNMYASGGAFSAGYTGTPGAYMVNYTGNSAWQMVINKYASAGSTRVYATYIGGTTGSGQLVCDYPLGLITDNAGNLFVLGTSGTTNYPTTAGCLKNTLGGTQDYVVTQFNATGTALLASTYLGGSGDDGGAFQQKAAGIFLGPAGDVYISGTSNSSDFPGTAGSYQASLGGGYDAVVAKLNKTLTALTWATYLGGSGDDNACDLKIATNGEVYVCGNTSSSNFPVSGGLTMTYQNGWQDGFISRLNSTGTALLSATYLGTSFSDKVKFLQLDKANNVYVLGATTSSTYPLTAGVYSAPGAYNYFIHKLNPALSTTIFSTCIGGPSNSSAALNELCPTAFGIDACENIYFTGSVLNGGFPMTSNAYTTTVKGLFICALLKNATALVYGSYFGGTPPPNGSHFHQTSNNRYDRNGVLYHTECTTATNYPLVNQIAPKNNSSASPNNDAASFKFDFNFSVPLDSVFAGRDTSFCSKGFCVTLKPILYPATTSTLNYLWSNGDTTATVTVCDSGTYWVKVYNSCYTVYDSLKIKIKPPFTTTTASTPATCGKSNGSATATVSGGSGTPVYQWMPVSGTTATLPNLPGGIYTVVVKEGLCRDTAKVTVAASSISLTTSSTPANCTASNGSATVMVSGSTGTVTYTWLPNKGNTATLSGIPTGIYTVVVTANGCNDTARVTVVPIGNMSATVQQVSMVSCYNGSNGSIHIAATGGTAPYSYSWKPAAAGNTAIATNLSAGLYTCVVKDSLGCMATDTVTITQPTVLKINAIGLNASCHGQCNGQLIGVPTGGTSAYVYSWSNGSANASATTVCAGTYTLVLIDAHGCKATDTALVKEPPALSIQLFATAAHCNKPDGIDSASASGGSPGYSYSWQPSPGTPSAVYTHLASGFYTVFVKDNNGCTDTATNKVPNLMGVHIGVLSSKPVQCHGDHNGAAVDSVSSGHAPFTYFWSPAPGTGQGTLSVGGLGAGTYQCTVTDSAGCTSQASVVITDPPVLVVQTMAPLTLCIGQCSPLTANSSGGTGPYVYAWTSGGTTQTSPVCPLLSTTYTVTATDSHGCIATNSVPITVRPPLTLSATGGTLCVGSNVGLTSTAGGGDGTFNYQWTPASTLSNASVSNPQANPTATTVYTVTATDNCGTPPVSATATVTVNPNPVLTENAYDTSSCNPVCLVFKGSSSPACMQASWSFGTGPALGGNCDTLRQCFTTSGTYTVTYTVKDINGCKSTKSTISHITILPKPQANFSASPQPTTIEAPGIQFTDMSTNAFTWSWNFGDLPGDTSTRQNPRYTYPDTGCYSVTLFVTSANGCTDRISKPVCIDPDFSFYAPNTFTPNGDGKNEVWLPYGVGIDLKHYELLMFDRWGNLMFETHTWGQGWDGRANGGATIAQIDTYVWKVNLKDFRGNRHQYMGHCNLIR
jgi:gliding motility-associated-like protein